MGRSPRAALLAAAASTVAAVVMWAAAFRTGVGARVDRTTLAGFLGLSGASSRTLADAVAQLASPAAVGLFTVAIVSIALVRRRPRHALTAGIALAGANLTTQALKLLTAEPRGTDSLAGAQVEPQSWPSGHATAAMTVALCLIVVAPRRLRPVAAAIGGGLALAVGYSVLLLGWHLPSDVLGGFCVAAAWTMTGLAVTRRRRDSPAVPASDGGATRTHAALTPALLLGLGLATAIAAVALLRPGVAFDYAEDNTTFVAAAAIIAAGAVWITAALAAAMRD